MARLPVISGRSLIRILMKRFGFRVLRQRGSHATLTNDISFITVSLHSELDIGTLQAILQDARIERDEFMKLV
jgi:predicted RNA binding protein YcfA (HicA-like mRNA interferase family)